MYAVRVQSLNLIMVTCKSASFLIKFRLRQHVLVLLVLMVLYNKVHVNTFMFVQQYTSSQKLHMRQLIFIRNFHLHLLEFHM